MPDDLLTKSFICLDVTTVPSDGIEHIQLEIPASLRGETQKKTCDSGEVSPKSNQRSRPNSGEEAAPKDRCKRRELLPRRWIPVAGRLRHACSIKGIDFAYAKRIHLYSEVAQELGVNFQMCLRAM